ncbi:LytR/AlgR family response regulator transcription factor [Dyadobacter frigoris]|uniref:LytR/AlgR family response regulator transcription factor n=1 Tax=Dyadobacter frigoris TaxID=2576211 RepID=UPI002555AC12|nr:response regulator [Dyadobacter frigoris]
MNTKLKCLLLDDELPGLTYLCMLCEQIPGLEVVKAFNNPVKLMKASETLDFDLCILDIEMPGLNGLEVAQLLKGKPVIFITAYKEFAAEAFDLDAVDYIRKPIQKERLEKAVLKAAKLLEKGKTEKQFMQLNTNKGKALVAFDQLLLITSAEKEKRDKVAYLENGIEITLKNISFEQLLALLPAENFCRISKKDIIALKAVRFFTHQDVTTTIIPENSERELVITLGDNFRKEFLEKVSS